MEEKANNKRNVAAVNGAEKKKKNVYQFTIGKLYKLFLMFSHLCVPVCQTFNIPIKAI